MPWRIAELPKLPAADVLDNFESEGWQIHQIVGPHPESGKIYVYLWRAIIEKASHVPADNAGVMRPQARPNRKTRRLN